MESPTPPIDIGIDDSYTALEPIDFTACHNNQSHKIKNRASYSFLQLVECKLLIPDLMTDIGFHVVANLC